MRVAIVVCGSRGDVQPMLAIAAGLETAGHDAIFCSSPDNEAVARSNGCAFEPIGEPLRGNASLGGWGVRAFNRFIRRQLYRQVRDLPRLVEDFDQIVASGLVWGVSPETEHLGIPYRYVAFTPAGLLGTTRDPVGIRLVRGGADLFADLSYGRALDRGRTKLGLPRARGVMRQLMGTAPIAATDRRRGDEPVGGGCLAPSPAGEGRRVRSSCFRRCRRCALAGSLPTLAPPVATATSPRAPA